MPLEDDDVHADEDYRARDFDRLFAKDSPSYPQKPRKLQPWEWRFVERLRRNGPTPGTFEFIYYEHYHKLGLLP